ncbi:uncharacterized protein LOC131317861 isoform X5 [Rhododendron vialii]|uniref:uncharacterized protein LOC131317861 isoform X5 n=1 Tax=Rhododendron vialii TaxID=182163 RepID=UPI00265DF520|nr:uncharacterized protein LOC131317861 isoform X5 [Rhododendron vialii]
MEACDRDSAMDENVTGEDEDQVFMHLFALFEVRVLSRHAIGASGMSKWDYIMEHTGLGSQEEEELIVTTNVPLAARECGAYSYLVYRFGIYLACIPIWLSEPLFAHSN